MDNLNDSIIKILETIYKLYYLEKISVLHNTVIIYHVKFLI